MAKAFPSQGDMSEKIITSADIAVHGVTVNRLALSSDDDERSALAARYLGDASRAVYLIRPDEPVAARWQSYDSEAVSVAFNKARGKV